MVAILQHEISPWPHRWAVALACATFPLVWVGGLVTTTDAGMAVPDWPSTYGYNLLLYPWQTWLAGPWDIFVEHGHRLLGTAVGLLTIGLVAVLWRCDSRRWVRHLGLAALALVIFQGVLGGMRVLLDERTLAMLHGCTAPLFFTLTVALVVVTTRTWQGEALPSQGGAAASVRRLAIVTAVLVYLQVMLGAVLRHVPVAAEPTVFAIAVKFHLALAAILVLHMVFLVWSIMRNSPRVPLLTGLAWLLMGLMGAQLALGAGTWLVKYSVPYWASGWFSPGGFTIQADGMLQTHVVTAHAALGSLLLATSVTIALYALRLLAAPVVTARSRARQAEVAL